MFQINRHSYRCVKKNSENKTKEQETNLTKQTSTAEEATKCIKFSKTEKKPGDATFSNPAMSKVSGGGGGGGKRPSVFSRLGTKGGPPQKLGSKRSQGQGQAPSSSSGGQPNKRDRGGKDKKKRSLSGGRQQPHQGLGGKAGPGLGRSPTIDPDWENWDEKNLDRDDEDMLEKKRQLLQRELAKQLQQDSPAVAEAEQQPAKKPSNPQQQQSSKLPKAFSRPTRDSDTSSSTGSSDSDNASRSSSETERGRTKGSKAQSKRTSSRRSRERDEKRPSSKGSGPKKSSSLTSRDRGLDKRRDGKGGRGEAGKKKRKRSSGGEVPKKRQRSKSPSDGKRDDGGSRSADKADSKAIAAPVAAAKPERDKFGFYCTQQPPSSSSQQPAAQQQTTKGAKGRRGGGGRKKRGKANSNKISRPTRSRPGLASTSRSRSTRGGSRDRRPPSASRRRTSRSRSPAGAGGGHKSRRSRSPFKKGGHHDDSRPKGGFGGGGRRDASLGNKSSSLRRDRDGSPKRDRSADNKRDRDAREKRAQPHKKRDRGGDYSESKRDRPRSPVASKDSGTQERRPRSRERRASGGDTRRLSRDRSEKQRGRDYDEREKEPFARDVRRGSMEEQSKGRGRMEDRLGHRDQPPPQHPHPQPGPPRGRDHSWADDYDRRGFDDRSSNFQQADWGPEHHGGWRGGRDRGDRSKSPSRGRGGFGRGRSFGGGLGSRLPGEGLLSGANSIRVDQDRAFGGRIGGKRSRSRSRERLLPPQALQRANRSQDRDRSSPHKTLIEEGRAASRQRSRGSRERSRESNDENSKRVACTAKEEVPVVEPEDVTSKVQQDEVEDGEAEDEDGLEDAAANKEEGEVDDQAEGEGAKEEGERDDDDDDVEEQNELLSDIESDDEVPKDKQVTDDKDDALTTRDGESAETDRGSRSGKKAGRDNGSDLLEGISDDDLRVSEDEGDEEARVTRARMADALDVDWSQLMARPASGGDDAAHATGGAFRERWSTLSLYKSIGLSKAFMGEEAYNEAIERVNEGVEENQQYRPLHPVAMMDVAMRRKEEMKKSLFTDFGPNNRALTQDVDVKIRKLLCSDYVAPGEDKYFRRPKKMDSEWFKDACKLLSEASGC